MGTLICFSDNYQHVYLGFLLRALLIMIHLSVLRCEISSINLCRSA
jgi:hypothetical protein